MTKRANPYADYEHPGTSRGRLRELVEEMRYRGHRGGIIQMHRAMLKSRGGRAKALQAAGLAVGLLAAWLIVMRWVSAAWAATLSFWTDALGIQGYVTTIHYRFAGLYDFTAPYPHIRSEAPDIIELLVGALLTLVLFIVSFLLPRRLLPVAYLMRIVAFFQLCAQIFFAFVPLAFPYGASGYVHGVLIAGLALITIVPIVLGFTHFIFDFRWWRKLGLAVLIMGYLCVLIPVQYMAHAFVLHHTSLLYLPLLFFVFGLPLNVVVFISFYSWGASWRSSLYEEDPPRGNGFFSEDHAS